MLAPDVALNLPAALDEAALLACLSVFTTNATTVPAPDTSYRPARHNYAGYCIMCGLHGCRSSECISDFARTTWAVCTECNGAGVDPASSVRCLCWGGLVEIDGIPVVCPCPNPGDARCSCGACQRIHDDRIHTILPGAQALALAVMR
ncbi:hypothetical protein [Micromonospora sp. RTP1Z1]|uniref:hypothetical protein n=1 Tax=Micromonospora sp. RTP1Z1 TaxID=2994043 RepID=UPI0029C84041|nr:hypothetical protein [Micromonospora sp. RTP1Z1]